VVSKGTEKRILCLGKGIVGHGFSTCHQADKEQEEEPLMKDQEGL
jgi:hypothetical protein